MVGALLRSDCELSDGWTDWDVRGAEASPMNCRCTEIDYAAGRQIFVTLRPHMAFTHIKRQGSMSSFYPPTLAFGMVYCYLVNSAFPSFSSDLMGPLLLGLGLSLGVPAILSMTQFLPTLRLQVLSLGMSLVA
jgi:hypothetical protein